ncbi:hypothetical protein BU24DRAFT_146517 [Aaosphaeria arxii CBS 175.79]|uniref:Intramembrane protease 2 n=1 Tax=Aaosphaeria arxii CBS 175.79 TaxID=1450172 RepID=A0A6A5XV94_9PLEO|nr:uncharacterized protein BU24DRAFT_146517 [Aaosphaeria arxii CBS 175.79]KAF2017235.1 hypothetical protein BU24DRAFT_146517 [Aaosphaeria arxii CBS 175.79]
MDADLFGRLLGRATAEFVEIRPLLPTYIHLIASALFPIYTGAHASLSRPTSAAKPTKRKADRNDDEDSDDEDEEEEYKMEGLSPTDAILMPLLAGCTLAGLYFLIKWLDDPKLLNKILNGYFAIFAVFSVSRLITDALDIGHSLIYPHRFAIGGALYHVDGNEKKALPVDGRIEGNEEKKSPLPGFLNRIPLTEGFLNILWSDRAMPKNKWTIRMYIHRVFAGKVLLGAHGIVGFAISLCSVLYFNFVDKPWYLTNLMGFGFSYGALQLMSPTTFGTGSLILCALFFYDIYFVFFTPMMVTVAKSLDVPIKLVFPRPSPPDAPSSAASHAMLGLGDVVLPGIMIGLALRFDLFVFYLRKQKLVKRAGVDGQDHETVEKAKYFSLAGRWSDHFWTHSLFGRPLFKSSSTSRQEQPFTFPKVYFKASLTGYILGMLATLGVMQIWGHAQPALLYLVPGVLGSLWLTALVRGELGLMWGFSEAVEEEEEVKGEKSSDSVTNSTTAPERSSFFSLSDKKGQEREDRMKKAFSKHLKVENESDDEVDQEPSGNSKKETGVQATVGHKPKREVLSFSIEAPWDLKSPRSIKKKPSNVLESENANGQKQPEDASTEVDRTTSEPAGKRVRRS